MNKIFATAASVLILGMASSAMAQSNNSTASQTGNSNVGFIEQLQGPALNDSYLNQNGNGNDATVKQNGRAGVRNDSDVFQTGDENTARVEQFGIGDWNESYINQNGNANLSVVKQGDIVDSNESSVRQIGNDNIARINQGGTTLGVNKSNKSTVRQLENNDRVLVNQGGTNLAVNESTITQDGNYGLMANAENFARVDQGGSSENDSIISQTGDDNTAHVTQSAGAGVHNISTVTQNGTGNGITVNQQ